MDPGPGEGKEHVALAQYGRNLQAIYRRLAPRARHVIWATTTPCPNVTTSMGRTDAKVRAYNRQALAALSAAVAAAGRTPLRVDDLHAAVDGVCGANYKSCPLQRPRNVHFEPQGCEFMAQQVVQTILSALGLPARQSNCVSQLRSLCENAMRASTGNCFVCTGQHANALRNVGCTEQDVDRFCTHL